MEILLTVLVVEHLASPGKQRLDVFPNPSGPITDHTKPHLILWNHTRLLDLLEGRTKLFLVVHLVPAQEMDYALVIDQIQPKALGISPLAVPRGTSGPRVTLPRLALPSAFGTRGHVRSIDAQHQHRTALGPPRVGTVAATTGGAVKRRSPGGQRACWRVSPPLWACATMVSLRPPVSS